MLPHLPSEEFRRLVCGDDWPRFLELGEGLTEMLVKLRFLEPDCSLLDVGCGCGRLARHLLRTSIGSYRGFDRHPGMIEWCDRAIGAIDSRFEFRFVPLRSAYDPVDGQVGTIEASTFEFPYPDASFDVVVAASVFTHMPPTEVANYLRNIRRMLGPGGRALVSLFHAEGSEPWDDGIGFHLPREQFDRYCSDARLKDILLFEPRFGPHHNWYRLEGLEA